MTERSLPNAAILSGWRKSSFSDNEGSECIEVLDGHPSGIPVRDSKIPHGPALVLPAHSWSSFITAVKSGRLSR
ncbi:DUF397 domain-containing protein [Streptomyces gilvosporeus]|uniref:DUF397 domain-containing protein n=1 Tax=Streptomyces gilvosporeus TaxID=553510 RepID=A0A1V0TTI2_9ACTN|nr:DUF397 domain-containing protein [Streptomyces gilvosporeus]ARF56275.1 DUF397 domain-containing protein [Streptomyces gilvosporeus]